VRAEHRIDFQMIFIPLDTAYQQAIALMPWCKSSHQDSDK
jgi:hypothetical protein